MMAGFRYSNTHRSVMSQDYNSEKLRETERVCQDLGITIIAYAPLGQGLLTEV